MPVISLVDVGQFLVIVGRLTNNSDINKHVNLFVGARLQP
jgi:hypothetical protein